MKNMTYLPFGGIFKNKKVLITGHTGFKGSWLAKWLLGLGADVYGYALLPPTDPALFELLHLENHMVSELADIRDFEQLKKSIKKSRPDIIFHMAAQSLVRESYEMPLNTIEVNTMGSANLMEAVRQTGISTAIVMVTTDKCYDNKEWLYGYREDDALGGYDPYSASKGAAEILISSWRNSFFNTNEIMKHGVRLASVRAGNVIGGGDWAKDRIVPDCIRDLQTHRAINVRNPHATRPWQHVLEPLSGYLQLGAVLLDQTNSRISDYCSAFNFGPFISSNRNVKDLVEKVIECWSNGTWTTQADDNAPHESSLLNLSIDKAYHKLNWFPRWDFDETVKRTVDWYKVFSQNQYGVMEFTVQQIHEYEQQMFAQATKQNVSEATSLNN